MPNSAESEKTILIIEDDKPLRQALVFKFENEGFTVVNAADGEAGLAAALKHHPDMILLDIVMPKMDGLTMLEKLRANSWGLTAQVIILSNLSDLSSANKAVENNIRDVLVKSDWKIDDVVKKVKEKLHLA